jgi:putative ABC transport system permease protein
MTILGLAAKSLRNRRFSVALTALSIALSVMLLLGVERIRGEVRASFTSTISGTDLIVGARSGPVQLLLYSVFRLGDPTQSIAYESYEEIARHPQVAWTIPLSLGDSHRGYRVLGTTHAYFEHFRYARERGLELEAGRVFGDALEAVLGAEVAAQLGYRLGDSIVVAHGAGEVSFLEHADTPFRIVGILRRTGTPVDRTIHVPLSGIEAMHEGFEEGGGKKEGSHAHEREHEHEPEKISAFLVGLKSRAAAPAMLRMVNEYAGEPLSAIMPAVALQELWQLVGVAETALRVVSALVLAVGLAGLLTALLGSLEERRREMAVLRSVGARPVHVFGLILGEAGFITLAGAALGLALLYLVQLAAAPLLAAELGLFMPLAWPAWRELALLAAVCAAGILVGVVPGARIYRYSLADGMTIRI